MKKNLTKENIVKIRKLKKMTQTEFARWVGCSERYLRSLENGENPITSMFEERLEKKINIEDNFRKACESEVRDDSKGIIYGYFAAIVTLILISILIF